MKCAVLLAVLLGACGSPIQMNDSGVAATDTGLAAADAGVAASDGGAIRLSTDPIETLASPFAPAIAPRGTAWLQSSREAEPAQGLRNKDWGNFIRTTGTTSVIAEQTGPGVVTRMWFTVGNTGSDADSDHMRLKIWIDGTELALDPDPNGIELVRLTSGTLPGFPLPWVMGRTIASGGQNVLVPLQYRQSLRIELTHPAAGWVYYQIEGRSLPEPPRSAFVFPPPETHDDHLANAAFIWREHMHPGLDQELAPAAIGAGAEAAIDLIGPGVITELEMQVPFAARPDVDVEITIDSQVVATARLSALTSSRAPAQAFTSAGLAFDDASATLYYPMPFVSNARVRLINRGTVAVVTGIRARVASGAFPPSLGRFRASCGGMTADVAVSICNADNTAQYPNLLLGAPLTGRGWYAGQTMFLSAPEYWWCGLEGDHEIYVDGQPAILGTGTEDYFGGAFYFMNGPYASMTMGASGWLRLDTMTTHHMYRHHLIDGVPFTSELRFEYESYVDGGSVDGCVFWYAAM
jgi:hypothetical protein